MQTLVRRSPIGPAKSDAVSWALFVPYLGGVVAVAFGIQGIGGLALLGAGFAMTSISGWILLVRDDSTRT